MHKQPILCPDQVLHNVLHSQTLMKKLSMPQLVPAVVYDVTTVIIMFSCVLNSK
jgi:hypothetical protein